MAARAGGNGILRRIDCRKVIRTSRKAHNALVDIKVIGHLYKTDIYTERCCVMRIIWCNERMKA